MNTPHDAIIEKIRKCLALSTSPNLNEAAAAAEMAPRLMLKYNIELYDIERANAAAAKRDEITAHDFPLGVGQGAPANWRRMLVFAIARHDFCKGISINGTRKMTIVGESHNIEIVRHLYEFLTREIERLADEGYPRSQSSDLYTVAKETGGQKYATQYYWQHSSRSWKNAFKTAAVEMLDSRLWKLRQNLLTQNETALAIRKDKEVEEKAHEIFPQMGKFQKADYTNREGQYAGYEAGNKLPLHNPVAGTSQTPRQLA